MKKLATLLLLCSAMATYATVWSVDNNENSAGQFTDLQTALDTSIVSAGDTLYVSGSPTSYGTITITRKVTLIGAGYNTNKENSHASVLNIAYYQQKYDEFDNLLSTPNGSVITGFLITNYIYLYGTNNLTISRNKMESLNLVSGNGAITGNSNNIFIKNNIISVVGDNTKSTNVVISNNIITTHFSSFRSSSVVITNNLFIGDGQFYYVEYAVVTNNIFYKKDVATNNDYCIFNNNISFQGTTTAFIYDNNTGANNQEAVNPLFVDVSGTAFDYAHDYHLSANSPGKNAGTDGTDIGIFGGASPFPQGGLTTPHQTSAFSGLPQMLKMNVQNTVLPADSTLHIEIQAIIPQ